MLPVLIAVLVAGALCLAYGIAIEQRWYRFRAYDLAILPPEGPETMDLLHLSDIHFRAIDHDGLTSTISNFEFNLDTKPHTDAITSITAGAHIQAGE